MRVKLKLIKSNNPNNPIGHWIIGTCRRLPILNELFELNVGPQKVITTKVIRIDTLGNKLSFKTVGSEYELEVLNE